MPKTSDNGERVEMRKPTASFKRLLFPIIALLLLMATVTACRRDESMRTALARAEALMESDPHAAHAVLDSLENVLRRPSTLSRQPSSPRLSKSDAALYALLRTQADHKCHIRLTSDSLPLVATHYYGTKHKTQRAALSQYYLGCAYKDMGRDLEAIDALLRATTLFPDTTCKYYAYNLLELGCLYMNHQMNDEAMSAFESYRHSIACETDSANIGYADYYVGLASLHKGDDARADSAFQLALCNTQLPNRPHGDILFQLAKLYYYHLNKPEEALAYINRYTEVNREGGASLLLKGDILSKKNEPLLAYKSYRQALTKSINVSTRCWAYKGLADIAPYLNKSDSILYFVHQYTALLDTVYSQSKQKEIAEVKDMHIVEIHDQQLKTRHLRFVLWMGIGAVVLVFGIVITFLLIDRKRKSERLKYEAQLNQIRQNRLNLAIRPEEDTQSVRTTAFDFKSQEMRKELYCNSYKSSEWPHYFQLHSSEIEKGDYMHSADKERFDDYLNAQMVDILLDLVKENPKLKSLDAEHCAMTLLGFRMKQIAYVSNSSYEACCMRRTRMKSRMTPEWYQFLFEKTLKD